MRTYSALGRFVSAMPFLVGLGACSDSDSKASRENSAEEADASSGHDERADAAAKPSRMRPDAAASDTATKDTTPKDDSSPEAPESGKAPETKPAEQAKPKKKASEPADAGAVSAKDSGSDAGPKVPPSDDNFSLRVVATGLTSPWEIIWGPDSQLWIAERAGRIVRMDPATGNLTPALSVSDVQYSTAHDGLLGMALHPQLGQALSNDFVYIAYTYDADPSEKLDRRARIVRYTYDSSAHSLGSPQTLLDKLPASSDNNAGRLVFGPDNFLYYSIGDQGHNQYENKCLPIRAQDLATQTDVDNQDWSAYQGKILRLGLNGSIPEDNPMIAGARTHIFSYGHRNARGLAFGPGGKLYATEPGPRTDDELNQITAGGNYGWPYVVGYRDDNAYAYANWSASMPETCDSLTFSDYKQPDSVPKQSESTWGGNYVAPLRTFYTVDNSFEFVDQACADDPSVCWPSIAPSSLDVYEPGDDGLKSWGTALLIPSAKKGSVLRVQLTANGDLVEGNNKELFKTTNRYRDLAIAPNKRTFYVVTDNEGGTAGPMGGATFELEHRGAVLEFAHNPTQ